MKFSTMERNWFLDPLALANADWTHKTNTSSSEFCSKCPQHSVFSIRQPTQEPQSCVQMGEPERWKQIHLQENLFIGIFLYSSGSHPEAEKDVQILESKAAQPFSEQIKVQWLHLTKGAHKIPYNNKHWQNRLLIVCWWCIQNAQICGMNYS